MMEVSVGAVSIVYLHAMKYPHLSVFGVLIGAPDQSRTISNAIPLFHGPFLAPMFETSMKLVS